MPNLAKAKIAGVDYDFKDTDARNAIYNVLTKNPEINLFDFFDHPSRTDQTITFTSNDDLTYTITGYSGDFVATVDLYSSSNKFPEFIEKGHTYYVKHKASKVYVMVFGFDGTNVTMFCETYRDTSFTIPQDYNGGLYIRFGVPRNSGEVNETIHPALYFVDTLNLKNIPHMSQTVVTNCDDFSDNGFVFSAVGASGHTIAGFPLRGAGWLFNCSSVSAGSPAQFQIALPYVSNQAGAYRIRNINGSWNNWYTFGTILDTIDNGSYASCDDYDKNAFMFISSVGGVPTIPDYPIGGAGWLFNVNAAVDNTNIRMQLAIPYDNSMTTQIRIRTLSGWTSWKIFGGGGGDQTTTITQEVSRDTYNNTYDINCTPQITTDSNCWLNAIDTDTADETGKTDMTGAIMAMLNANGYCHLGPGIFYVSGNIDMPADSMIEGCGKKTIIRLLQSTTSGYIVRMHTRSTIKNVCFSGGYSALDISTGDIGGRKGINYIGNRDGQDTDVTPTTCTLCQVEGCWFENLDSGFYGYNAGGGLQEGIEMSNCYFTRCKAGINIDYWTEYCKFTNIVTFQCYFACINNGGNNVFTACTFHGVIGFLIDNSSGTKSNSAHGTVNGCTFNHIDNMNHPDTAGNGYGVKVIDTGNGFIFANCQFWYGKVYVEDSNGIQFADSEFGGYPTIETSGSGTVFFNGCIFQTAPSKSTSSPVKFDNCYTYAGLSVTN